MSFHAQRLTREVRKHDKDLYVLQPQIGGTCFLMRRSTRLVKYSFEGQILWASERDDKQLLALTDTWGASGRSVEWGVMPLMEKIRSIDSHNDTHDGGIIARLERERAEREESKRRHTRTLHESLAYEAHGAFRKAFKDINAAGFSDPRRRKGN